MKKWLFAAMLAFLCVPGRAQQEGSMGLGIIAGEPTAVSVKYWTNSTLAFDLGLGFSDEFTAYADALWNSWTLLPKPQKGSLDAYAGLGPRVEAEGNGEFGLRTVVGVGYWIENHPIEIFVEGGPVFILTQDQRVEADAGLGIRFYFSSPKPRG